MARSNKDVIRTIFEEIFNKHRVELIPQCYSEDICACDPANGCELNGHDEVKNLIEGYREADPDHYYTLHEIVGEEDHVAVRWTAHLPGLGNGSPLELEGLSLCRFRDGKIDHVWQHYDNLKLLAAKGAVPHNLTVPSIMSESVNLA